MEIDEKINEWLIQVETELQSPQSENDISNFCLGIIPIIRNYTTSILLLLNNDRRLTTKALLRVFSELVLKFCWCLKDAEVDKTNFYRKNERWVKTANEKRKKFLEKSLSLPCNDEERQTIQKNLDDCESLRKKLAQQKIKGLSGTMGLFKDLFANNAELNYLLLYHQFNDAIHPDLFLLNRLTNIGTDTAISDDEVEDIEVLKQICLCCVYLFLESVYKYHKLDFALIKSNYERLKEK